MKSIKKIKGFTIVELLAAIVILAIIATLAVTSYGKVVLNVKQKAYENLKELIETKASDYANDTGNLLTNVDELVKKGYLDADDEEGNIKNPVDGNILNCHIVSIRNDNEVLYGEYSEEEECDLSKLTMMNLNLKVNLYTTEDDVTQFEKIESGSWTNKNVILEATVGDQLNGDNIASITWQSNALNETYEVDHNFGTYNTYLVKVEQIINTYYTVTLKMKDGTNYQARVLVRVDKQNPMIHEIKIDKEKEWTSEEKLVTITASDGNGSGVYGYYVGIVDTCNDVDYVENEGNTYEVSKDAGTYYVCVKDKVGNLSEEVSTRTVVVENIDKNPPSITPKQNPLTMGNGDYEFKNNVNVTWSASGEGSVSCNPTISKKTGVYNVTCTAIGNNGLSSETTFQVKHNYPAVWLSQTCTRREPNCVTKCGSWTYHDHNGNTGTGCNGPAGCTCNWHYTACGTEYGTHEVKYDCSHYTCPQGGTLRDAICYYE